VSLASASVDVRRHRRRRHRRQRKGDSFASGSSSEHADDETVDEADDVDTDTECSGAKKHHNSQFFFKDFQRRGKNATI